MSDGTPPVPAEAARAPARRDQMDAMPTAPPAGSGAEILARDAAARAQGRLVAQARDALPPELAHLAAGPLAEALAQAVDFARASISPATAKIYADDWAAFRVWADAKGAPALPAPPAIVAAYLADCSARMGKSGLRLILAAIAHHHRRAGHVWAGSNPVIAAVMKGISRTQQRPVKPAAALTSEEIRLLLAACGTGPRGPAGFAALRDRALLLTGFAGGLRRGELVALDREDLVFAPDTVTLRIRRSKSDQEGAGAEVLISAGTRTETCPVQALRDWLQAACITYGPVFRRVTAAGTIEGRLTGNGVWRILRRRAAQAGLKIDDGERLSPHGLRAGFITEAYLHGALDEQVMAHARQKSLNTTRRYRSRAKTVAASPTRLLDL